MEDFTEVFVWGSDHFGQLGLGNSHHKSYPIPKFCSFSILIKSLSCGDHHSGFVSSSGHIYTMGSNIDGRLGIGDFNTKFSASPCLVDSLAAYNVSTIACGGGHSLVTTDEGKVYAWGCGESGALGQGNTQNQWTPINVRLVSGATPVQVSCGTKHSAVLLRTNVGNCVYMCGSGESGQLGTGKREKELQLVQIKTSEEMVQIACGVFHSGLVSASGKVFVTGGNSFGQLGLGTKKSTCVLQKVEAIEHIRIRGILCAGHSAAISDTGDVYVWGTGVFGAYVLPHKVCGGAREVSIGGSFTLVVKDDGIYSWGNNTNGELGLGDYEVRESPAVINALQGKRIRKIACGNNFAIVLGEDIAHSNGPAKMKKASTPLRMPGNDYSGNKQAMRESPNPRNGEGLEKAPESYENKEKTTIDRLFMRRGILDRNTIEKNIIERKFSDTRDDSELFMIKKNYESLQGELVYSKEENRRLADALSSEQARNSSFSREIEDIRMRSNEALRDQENQLTQSHFLEMHKLKMQLEETKHQVYSLEIDIKSGKDEISRLQHSFCEQEIEFSQELSMKLESNTSKLMEMHNSELNSVQYELDQAKIQLKQLETNLAMTNSHKSRLEESLFSSNSQVDSLSHQIEGLKLQISTLESSNRHKSQEFEHLTTEKNAFYQETLEKESEREHMIRLIEDKIQELEEDRSKLVKERDSLHSVVTDLTYELNRSHQVTSEHSQTISSLQQQLIEESDRNSTLLLDLEGAKGEILLLEMKNTDMFEGLQKELSQRAKEYKERTLTLLSTPGRTSGKATGQELGTPNREPLYSTPGGETYVSRVMPSIELIAKTEKKNIYPSRSQQERINAAAVKLMQRPESPLKNIRISSPGRHSPERPSPYKGYLRSTPEVKSRSMYVV